MKVFSWHLPFHTRKSTEEDSSVTSKDILVEAPKAKPRHHKLWKGHRKPSYFPFLELPREIRQLIYGYLVPDRTVVRWRTLKRHRAALREDSSKCCAALLRVNRRLYRELYLEWYSKVPFRLDIRYGHLHYLNHQLSSCRLLQLYPTFLLHSKISIRLRCCPYGFKRNIARQLSILSSLCVLLSPGGRTGIRGCRLKELEIQFRIPALVELRYDHPKLWAESVDVLGYLRYYLLPLNHFICLKDPPKISLVVVERELFPRSKGWRAIQERDRRYDDRLLRNANRVLDELAAKMRSTRRGWKMKDQVDLLENEKFLGP